MGEGGGAGPPGRWDRVPTRRPPPQDALQGWPFILARAPSARPAPCLAAAGLRGAVGGRQQQSPLPTWPVPPPPRSLGSPHPPLPLQTAGGRRQTREWWRDPRCHPAKPLHRARRPSPEPQTQRRGREPAPRSGKSLPTRGAAHSPHPGGGGSSRAALAAPLGPPLPQENAAAGLASCSASCASVPPPPPLRGSVGATAPGLGQRGGGSGSTTTWPPGAGPRRPGSSGSEKGGARLSPPLPPRAAPNSASQVTRPRAAAGTRGGCCGRSLRTFRFPGIVDPSPRTCPISITVT